MTYEVWEEDTSVSMAPKGVYRRPRGKKLFEFDAASWPEANQKLHQKMGWEPSDD